MNIPSIYLVEPYNPYTSNVRKKHWMEIVEEEAMLHHLILEQLNKTDSTSNVATGPAGAGGVPPYSYFQDASSYSMRSITTDASSTPTSNQIQLTSTQNAIRIFSGETPATEPSFFVYVSRNGGTPLKVKMYRWQGRIIICPSGATVSIGTDNGRSLTVSPMTLTLSSLTDPSGATGTVNCDKAGPPLWTPTAPHLTFLENGASFTINSNGTRRVIFVSEYDGTSWSPMRWHILPANDSINIKCTYTKVALANFDGATVSVTAPTGTIIGGTSTRMSLTFPVVSGTSRIVSSSLQLNAAISQSMAGDEIVLSDGIYIMTQNISEVSFSANVASGYKGCEGITIRGQSGNRENCIISSSATVGYWNISNSGSTRYCGFKDLTFDFNLRPHYFILGGGYAKVENVRWTNNFTASGGNWGLCNFNALTNAPIYADVLWCQADNAGEDCISGFGIAGNTNGVSTSSIVRLIGCNAYNSGRYFTNSQVMTTHNYQPLYVYGGNYYNCQNTGSNLIANGALTEAVNCYFSNLYSTTASNVCKMNHVNLFACYTTGSHVNDTIMPVPNGYLLFNHIERNGYQGTTNMSSYGLATLNTGSIVVGNYISASNGRVLFMSANGVYLTNNIILGFAEAIRTGVVASENVPTTASTFWNNTWISNSVNISNFTSSYGMNIINNAWGGAAANTIFNFSAGVSASLSGRNYNVFHNANLTGYNTGSNDIVSQTPQINIATFEPVASGNCDLNGSNTIYNYVGDSDYVGKVFIQSSNTSSRGAIARQVVNSTIDVYPDVW